MEDLYRNFVIARHRAWLERITGTPVDSLSEDEKIHDVVRSYRFTNVFRILDWGSQYVVRSLIHQREEDLLPSLVLYRLTNVTPPWEFYEILRGHPPTFAEIASGETLEVFRDQWAQPMFGTAYRVHTGRFGKGIPKLDFVVNVASLVTPDYSERFRAGTPEQRFAQLMELPRIGEFLAMQILTDYGYAGDDCENDFIVPGPGAVRGAELLGSSNPTELIYSLRDEWAEDPDSPVLLNGRLPSLMDVQNTLCEYQKFARYYEGSRGTSYSPKHRLVGDTPVLPRKWRLLK